MNNSLRQIIFSKTSQDSSILFIATLLSSVFNFILVYILTRNLSTGSFGLIITALTFTQLITDMGELGINSASLNYIAKEKDKLEKFKLIKASLNLKVLLALVTSFVVLMGSPLIASLIFKNHLMIPLIAISSLGIFISMILVWGQTILQSEKNFVWVGLVNLSPNVFRVLAVLCILFLYSMDYLSVYVAITLVLFLSVSLAFFKIGNGFLSVQTKAVDYKKIFQFGLPVGLGFAVAAIYTRLDQIMVFNLLGEKEAGIYGLSSRLSGFFVFAVAAIVSAVTPRIASLEKQEFDKYFKKVVFLSIGLSSLCLLSTLLSPLILYIFGDEYSSSVLPFNIQLIGIAFFAVSTPFTTTILFRFNKTGYSFWLSLASFAVIIVLLNNLIPIFGNVGAALSLMFVYLIQLFGSVVYYFLMSKRYAKSAKE